MMQALKREIFEELGSELAISEITPWTLRDTVREKLFADGSKQRVYMIFLIFDCLAENAIIQLNEEFETYAWVKPDELINFDLYPIDFKIWVFGGFKATKFDDRSRLNIVNIESAPIVELR